MYAIHLTEECLRAVQRGFVEVVQAIAEGDPERVSEPLWRSLARWLYKQDASVTVEDAAHDACASLLLLPAVTIMIHRKDAVVARVPAREGKDAEPAGEARVA